MRIQLTAIGTKMPAWVTAGYAEYANRMPRECRLELREVPLTRRGKNDDPARLRRDEAARLSAALPERARIIALEVHGQKWTTEQLAGRLGRWLGEGRDVALLVGGPDGLDPELSQRADDLWSLSPLTLPHPLVRVVLAEQLYRAWTLHSGHPYHRG